MRRAVAALAIVLCALVIGPVASAQAGPPWGRGQHRHRGNYRGYHPHWKPASPWGSFWGGVLGGWVGSQIGQATRPDRDDEDVEADMPEADLKPWSKGWYAYCTGKYKSFDPETGRYLGYDGQRHFCK